MVSSSALIKAVTARSIKNIIFDSLEIDEEEERELLEEELEEMRIVSKGW